MDFHAVTSFFSSLPLDWVILAGFAALAIFDSMRAGPGRAIIFSLAFPLVLVFLQYLPSAQFIDGFLKQFTTPLSQTIIIFILFGALALMIGRMMESFSMESGQIIQSVIAGVSAAIVFAVIWTQLPALTYIWHFNDQVTHLFGETYRFWWLLLAYAGLGFSRA